MGTKHFKLRAAVSVWLTNPWRLSQAASLTLHLTVLMIAVWFIRPYSQSKLLQHAISVQLIAPPPRPAAAPSTAAPLAVPPEPLQTEASPTPPVEPEMIHADKMLTGAVFADPRNAGAREMLGKLDPGTRREQLCDIEAVEQIHARTPEKDPVGVVAYAFATTRTENGVMTADGAAVQFGAQWSLLRFVCTLSPDLTSVTAFDYAIGDLIPESEWDSHGLSVGAAD